MAQMFVLVARQCVARQHHGIQQGPSKWVCCSRCADVPSVNRVLFVCFVGVLVADPLTLMQLITWADWDCLVTGCFCSCSCWCCCYCYCCCRCCCYWYCSDCCYCCCRCCYCRCCYCCCYCICYCCCCYSCVICLAYMVHLCLCTVSECLCACVCIVCCALDKSGTTIPCWQHRFPSAQRS